MCAVVLVGALLALQYCTVECDWRFKMAARGIRDQFGAQVTGSDVTPPWFVTWLFGTPWTACMYDTEETASQPRVISAYHLSYGSADIYSVYSKSTDICYLESSDSGESTS